MGNPLEHLAEQVADDALAVVESRAVSNAPWGDVSASDYADANAYCSACLIDMNPSGQAKVKGMCKLPVKMPNGDLNRQAVFAAGAVLAGARGGVDAPPAAKAAAAKKLMAHYSTLKANPPESVRKMAGA